MTTKSSVPPPRTELIVATKALEQVSSDAGFIPEMLYLCALDAESQGKKELGLTALKRIVRHYDDEYMRDGAKEEVQLPVVFRYLSHVCSLCLTEVRYSIHIRGNGSRTNFR